ncbi:hypothetical protein COJ90_21250 [Priestia megaterium]|uniref:DUF3978 family protein n=1 Tax=Priestia megaterium TaxID=1404 RepID=UPI000BF27BD4|nr:DUF3978 family protein [Priestia megaterium]PFP09242.1 hypothetical protein COJ90_21250 [Priestia megaterium]
MTLKNAEIFIENNSEKPKTISLKFTDYTTNENREDHPVAPLYIHTFNVYVEPNEIIFDFGGKRGRKDEKYCTTYIIPTKKFDYLICLINSSTDSKGHGTKNISLNAIGKHGETLMEATLKLSFHAEATDEREVIGFFQRLNQEIQEGLNTLENQAFYTSQ